MKSSLRQPSKNSILKQIIDAEFPIESVLDIGIRFGTPELMRAFPKKKHYLFEPIEENYETIEKNYRGAGIEFELNKVAVSNSDGTAELQLTSVNKDHSVTHAKFADGEEPTQTLREVPMLKLDTFVAEKNPVGPYLVKIDVDGAEELILEGAQQALQNCSVLIVEAPRTNLFRRLDLAVSAGFELLDIVDFCYYDGYMWQVDLVLVNPKFAPAHFVDMLKVLFHQQISCAQRATGHYN